MDRYLLALIEVIAIVGKLTIMLGGKSSLACWQSHTESSHRCQHCAKCLQCARQWLICPKKIIGKVRH